MSVNGVEPCASGAGLLEMRRALEARVGADKVRAALARLPAEQREPYEQMSPLSWVPLSVSWAVIEAVAREAGEDPDALYEFAIREGIQRAFKTVWKVLLHFTSDEALVARTAVIYAKSRNVGKMTAQIMAPGRGEQTITEWPGMLDRHVLAIALSVEAVLRMAGRKEVRVSWHVTRDGAVIKSFWKP